MIEERYSENLDIDESDPRTSWSQIIRLAGGGKRILDIGCWIGKTAEKLTARGNSVVGVEINPAWARKARDHCETVFCGDVEDEEFWRSIPGGFDVVILGDVLEHLVDPWALLKRLHEKLNPDACVMCSIPNIANWRPRIRLMLGRFEYSTQGIQDQSHLRFFTRSSAERMFADAGFRIEYFGVTSNRIPHLLARLIPTLFSIQFVYRLKPAAQPNLLRTERI